MIKSIVTDIEGTTSSLTFVKDVLFPYAHKALPDFIKTYGGEPHIAKILAEVREIENKPQASHAEATTILQQWIEQDRKLTPLKTLQGFIWEAGFRQGAFQGHIYKDAAETLQRWHKSGLQLYIYSSGSIHAQKLLFGYSAAGDLTPLFSGFFDTTTGGKLDAESYRKIATSLNEEPDTILFLSDNVGELDAARHTGMQTIMLDRAGGADAHGHDVVKDFDAIKVEDLPHAACA